MNKEQLKTVEDALALVFEKLVIEDIEIVMREGSGVFMYSRESYNLEEFFD